MIYERDEGGFFEKVITVHPISYKTRSYILNNHFERISQDGVCTAMDKLFTATRFKTNSYGSAATATRSFKITATATRLRLRSVAALC